jgi:RNA polymerase sigma factor (sigma-70 family)
MIIYEWKQKTGNTLIKPTKEFWTQAYQTNIGKLTGICYRYTGNYQLSEDLAHDAFLKAIEKFQSFRGDGNFDAWVRRIVINHVLQHLRDQKKHPYVQQLTPEQAAAIAAQDNTAPAQPMEFTTTELLETIDQLPDHHRLVFNLYVLEKFSHTRIGDELGISEGTSKSHLARARKKLQHLLAEKVNIQKKKDNGESAAILLLALADDARTDQLFIEGFDRFSIPPQRPLSLRFPHRSGSDLFKKLSSKRSFRVVAAFSVGIAITLYILFIVKSNGNHAGNKFDNSASISVPTDKDAMSRKKDEENVPSPSATILQGSVNTGRNKKLQSMKPLDSLALILALSSATVNASSSKDSIRHQIENASVEMPPVPVDSTPARDQLKPDLFPKVHPDKRGTFRASALFWNKDNREVYFKGEVRVDFKDQHFQGKGSFDILGTVYLLIVDDQQVALGERIKLSEQDYDLTVLNSAEASSKYGDLGKNGAVVINRSNIN